MIPRVIGLLSAIACVLGLVAAPAIAQVRGDDPLPPELREWVREHGALRVGYLATAAPVGIIEDGEVTGGWAFELHRLMGIKLGVDVESVVHSTLPDLVEALRTGDIDLVAATGSRPDLVEFAESTEPLSWTPLVFVGGEEQQRLGVSSFVGRTATTIPGSPIEARLREGFPDLTYVPTEGIPAGLSAVAQGDVDLYLGPLAIVGYQLGRLGLVLGPVGDPVDVIEVPAWGRSGSEALAIARIGRSLLTDAELSVVHVRWTGFDLGNPDQPTPRWIITSFLVGLGLVLVLGLFALVLRRRVAHATADLTALNLELEDRVAERTSEVRTANDRLRSTNEALSKFARTVAHDLRGPVTAIAGLAELLRKVDVGTDKQGEVVVTIHNSAGRLTNLIDTLLEDAVQVGAADPYVDGAEFRAWLEEVVAPELEAIDASIELDIPDRPLDTDRMTLRRAAVNLVGNATKYAANVDGTRIRVSLTRDDDEWRLVVEDNGPGVPQPQWSHIFDAGFRASDDDRGHGLGLADVRELVQGAGGSIRVGDSGDLGGARFTVGLPVTVAASIPKT